MNGVDAEVDRLFEARAAIFAHVGYVEDWRVLPIDDSRDQFWAVDEHERAWVKFSPKREALAYWLADHDDEYGPYGNDLYENVIYTQRHLPKWVYRGAELTLVVADTQTDGNKYLQIFRSANEVKLDDGLSDQALNVAIDRMIVDDQVSPAEDLLAKVRSMCAQLPIGDLRVAIDVHRANCRHMDCPVLAAMEDHFATREAVP